VNEVVHPRSWPEYGGLKVSRTAYFRNVLAARRFETARALALAGRPAERGVWAVVPQSASARYDASRGELVVPAGLLQPPFFGAAAPDPVNFGAAGAVIGRELFHALVAEVPRLAAAGDTRDRSAPAAGELAARAACLVEQAEAFEPVPGVRLDGRRTLRENAADLAGVRLAFAAMAAWQARQPEPQARAKHLGFTPEQQFFVAHAQSSCSAVSDDELRRRAAEDPRAPAPFRVNGPLSNLPEFAEAFRCAPGDPMVRPEAERCASF
jgi:endothelin-converting enzyme/putative endopeptidase